MDQMVLMLVEFLVYLKNLNSNEIIFRMSMDSGEDYNKTILLESIDENTIRTCFKTLNYWEKQDHFKNKDSVVEEVVIRFKMPNKQKSIISL